MSSSPCSRQQTIEAHRAAHLQMSQTTFHKPDFPWGTPPSARYESIAAPFRPIIEKIREKAVERDLEHRLPHTEIGWLKQAGFTRLRLPREWGGQDANLPELFGLLVELGAADTNIVNALRAQLGFIEDVLHSPEAHWRSAWLDRLSRGDLIGSGSSEAGEAKVNSFSTRLHRTSQGLTLEGQKFYTTGSLFADWINVVAQDDEGKTVTLQVPRTAPGVELIDDWDGFGQALTASGTARFKAVVVDPTWVKPGEARFPYATAFYQSVHLASLAGTGRALADDLAQRVRQRDRVYSHGNAARVADDPQILQVVGRVRSAAYGASAIVRSTSQALQRSFEATRNADLSEEARQSVHVTAHVEVSQAVSVVPRLILEASTELFDALGSSATLRTAGLDRYWRNARTITSHNPRVYRERQVGDFAVNDAAPPSYDRIGKA